MATGEIACMNSAQALTLIVIAGLLIFFVGGGKYLWW